MTDVVCQLSPPGVSSIAVIGFRGPTVWQKLSPYFQPAQRAPELGPEASMCFGRLCEGDMGDEVVLVLQGDAREQVVEVQTHGGPGVVAWVMQLAVKLGCRWIEWAEWLREYDPCNGLVAARVALAGEPPVAPTLTVASNPRLWSLLPQAITKKTAAILLDQCHGGMERELARIRSALSNSSDRSQLLEEVQRLCRLESLGQHLVHPWKVVIAGAPNAGKSSLLNALLGFERAITSPMPGTTRDVVTAMLVWQGYPFELIDTAGLRESGQALETAGMELARRALREADVVLWLVDLAEPRPTLPHEVQPTTVVGTKADLPRQYQGLCDLRVSAVTGEGLSTLLDALLRRVVPEEPGPGQAVPVLPEHREELRHFEKMLGA